MDQDGRQRRISRPLDLDASGGDISREKSRIRAGDGRRFLAHLLSVVSAGLDVILGLSAIVRKPATKMPHLGSGREAVMQQIRHLLRTPTPAEWTS